MRGNRYFAELLLYLSLMLFVGNYYITSGFLELRYFLGYSVSEDIINYLRLFIILVSGVYLGLLLTIIIKDDTKRLQALIALIIVATIIAKYFALSKNFLHIEILNSLILALGFSTALSLILTLIISAPQICDENYLKNRGIILITAIIPFAYVVLYLFGLLLVCQYNILNTKVILNIIVTVCSAIILYKFTVLDIGLKSLAIIGDSRSGKTVMSAILYNKIVNKAWKFRPVIGTFNKRLQKIYTSIVEGKDPDPDTKISELRLPFKLEIIPFLLRRCVNMIFLDYPGGYTAALAEIDWKDIKNEELKKIAEHILESNNIMFIIDGERIYKAIFLDDARERVYINTNILGNIYKIITKLNKHDKKYYILITKCDLFNEDLIFKEAFDKNRMNLARDRIIELMENKGIDILALINTGVIPKNRLLLIGVHSENKGRKLNPKVIRYDHLFKAISEL